MMFRLLPFLGLICAIHAAPGQKHINGKVTFNGPKDLPAHSVVEVRFQDVSLMDVAAKVLSADNITTARSFPISFKLPYKPSEIRPGHRYSLSARITGPDGKLHYINDMHISVDLSESAEPTIDVPVIKIGGSPSDNRKTGDKKICPAVNCGGKSKKCAYGYHKNTDGCEICKCNDPCNPSGKALLCGPNQRCFIDRKADGTFATRCGVAETHKPNKNAKNAKAACKEPKKTGMCEAAIPRFYYNSATKSCEPFTYGGCGANGNNFETKIACERFCKA